MWFLNCEGETKTFKAQRCKGHDLGNYSAVVLLPHLLEKEGNSNYKTQHHAGGLDLFLLSQAFVVCKKNPKFPKEQAVCDCSSPTDL